MKIKFKILAGFFLIIAMLVVAGSMSIYEFSKLSGSVTALIDDNYKTIEACKKMNEALEREDSGILLLISGQWEKGRDILATADSVFNSAYTIAKNNVTEEDEDKFIAQIESTYRTFKEEWEHPIVGTEKENSIDWYYEHIHTNFLLAKSDVEKLMTLNQDSMYDESLDLKDKAHRAIMPGIVAIVAALIFLIIFNFFVSKYFVNPITNLVYSLKSFSSGSQKFDADIKSKDELKVLETEIQNLISRLKLSQKK